MRKKPLSEQVVLVTGASSGLGRAIARLAGARGAKVVVSARNAGALENCVGEIEDAGSEALAVPGDVADQPQVARAVETTVERFGRIDTYVANDRDRLRRGLPARARGAAPRLGGQLLRRRLRLLGRIAASESLAQDLPARQLGARLPRHPAAGRVLLDQSGPPGFPRVVAGRRTEGRNGVAISLVLPGAINTPQFDRDRQKLGYQPEPVPPIYQPEPFAEATLHCAEHPVRELPISWGAQKLLWGQKLSPRAGDWVLRRTGWRAQHTADPKPLDAPDNLFDTLLGDPGAHGRFDRQARGSTLWTRLRLLLPKG